MLMRLSKVLTDLISKMKNSKRGSYILEASIVMPVIIVAVVTVVLIIMFFYSQMTEQAKMHMALRMEAGIASETTYTAYDPEWDGEIYIKKNAAGAELYGKKYVVMSNRGLLEKKGIFVVEDKCVAVDAPRYVRYCSLVKGIKNEE